MMWRRWNWLISPNCCGHFRLAQFIVGSFLNFKVCEIYFHTICYFFPRVSFADIADNFVAIFPSHRRSFLVRSFPIVDQSNCRANFGIPSIKLNGMINRTDPIMDSDQFHSAHPKGITSTDWRSLLHCQCILATNFSSGNASVEGNPFWQTTFCWNGNDQLNKNY